MHKPMAPPIATPEHVASTAVAVPAAKHTPGRPARLRLLARLAMPIGLAVAACGTLIWYLLRHQDQWQAVSLSSPWMLVVCGAAMLAALLAPGPIFWVMTSRVGRDVGLAESTCLAVMTTAINTVVPLHGGAAARALYLKRQHDLHLSSFAATFIGYNILRLFIASAAACAAGGWLLARRGGAAEGLGGSGLTTAELSATSPATAGLEGLVAIAGALALAAIAGCLVRPAWLGRLGLGGLEQYRLLKPLFTFQAGWHELMRCPRFLMKVLALVMLQIAAELVVVWAAWAAVGVSLMGVLLRRWLPATPVLRNVLLVPPAARDESLEEETLEELLGLEGTTTTRLAPAGKARIGGRLHDVTSDGPLVEPGMPIRVVEVRGGRVLVKLQERPFRGSSGPA